MMESSRLRNSGENFFLIIDMPSELWSCCVKPIDARLISWAPALVVITRITLRKSALRPLLSVSVPWSITCRSRLKTSGSAFSISSSNTTACGFLLTASVNKPPWSNPTYPGGAPMRRDTVCRSMYSDISKRMSSTPINIDNCRVTSVLPTPVGPANRNVPIGFSSSRNPDRDILIAPLKAAIALSWPKIVSFRSRSMVRSASRSDDETLFSGIRAIFATIASIMRTVTRLPRSATGCRRRLAPASSITSMALSGRWRSLICLTARSTAASSAESSYLMPWCSSNRVLRPLRIAMVSSTLGSGTSIF